MRLLISVADAQEASAALAGGADVIDAKDARAGALAPVTPAVLAEISAVVAWARPVTAALGDADDEASVERAARAYVLAGAALVKIGFAGIADDGRAASILAAAVRGAAAGGGAVVAVGYADVSSAAAIAPAALARIAADAGAQGMLLDTCNKSGPGLRALVDPAALAAFVTGAHRAGLLVALAGRLAIDDLTFVRDAGADIAGVRGAACEGGRIGRVTRDRVAALRAVLESDAGRYGELTRDGAGNSRVTVLGTHA